MSRPDPFELEITPDLVIRAYRAGIFPMAESAEDEDLFWVSPEQRGIIPLDRFHISKSLKKAIRRADHDIRVDSDFDGVITACASVGEDREITWINETIRSVYGELFRRGVCHTIEVWREKRMIGGLYGLGIGGAFFGESMFHRETDASKIALAHLVERLKAGGYALLDTQFLTDHLRSLGGIEIKRELYEMMLAEALDKPGDFYALDRQEGPIPDQVGDDD